MNEQQFPAMKIILILSTNWFTKMTNNNRRTNNNRKNTCIKNRISGITLFYI